MGLRIYLESEDFTKTEVTPRISGVFTHKKENGKAYYRLESNDKFEFHTREDWALLSPYIGSECSDIFVIVEKICAGDYVEVWRGVFKMFDADGVDFKICNVEVKPEPLDEYTCFEQAVKEEQNIFNAGPTITSFGVGGEYEIRECVNTGLVWRQNIEGVQQIPPPNVVTPNPLSDCFDTSTYCIFSNNITITRQFDDPQNGNTIEYDQVTKWHREISVTNCANGQPIPPAIGTGWVLLENCTEGKATYYRCPASGGPLAGDYKNGRSFSQVVQKIAQNLDCSLTVKSNFFGINPVSGDSPDNKAYQYAALWLQNMNVHQKSDVKRKNATSVSSAPSWTLKAKDFFEDMYKIFKVQYIISDNILILEHESYFVSTDGLDVSESPDLVKKIAFTGGENVKFQRFYWNERSSSVAFKSSPIIYDCGTESKEISVSLFSTDILYTETEENAENVSDEGFMLVATEINDIGVNLIIDNNKPLQWNELLHNLHTWGALYRTGRIGLTSYEFDSYVPYVKQEKFTVSHCCEDFNFSPYDLVVTKLTDRFDKGKVAASEINFITGRMALELVY